MVVSLDTNIWIFGLVGGDVFCELILLNVPRLTLVIPEQVRAEVERNLSPADMHRFYQKMMQAQATIDFEPVPADYIAAFEQKGLKKGDAEIGAFCEWRGIDILVSHNRDFLRGLAPDHRFTVLSPQQFCECFELR